jgi:hypothetical protein
MIQFLTDENDITSILKTDTIIYFYNDNQLLNEMMQPILSILNQTNEIVGIDTEAFNKTIKRFDIKEMPTILFFAAGRETKRISGISDIIKSISK